MFDDDCFGAHSPPPSGYYLVETFDYAGQRLFEIWHPDLGRVNAPYVPGLWMAVVLWALQSGKPVQFRAHNRIDNAQWARYLSEFERTEHSADGLAFLEKHVHR